MAKPITITPTLKDKASVKFNERLAAEKNVKASQADKDRIASLVAKVLANSKK